MTQPTEGFGQVVPRPRRARASAARIIARSVEVLSRREVAAARPPSIVIRGDPPDKFAEILRLPEIAVDRGEADIGNLIKCRQRFHDQFADVLARNLGVARTFELAHQGVDDSFHPLGFDRPLAQRDIDRARQLVALERLPLSVLLDDRQLAQLHPLKGREARGAIRAEAAATDRAAILSRARILDLGVVGAAERTAHFLLLVPRRRRGGRSSHLGRTRCSVAESPPGLFDKLCRTSPIHAPTWRNSAAPKPRVVAAGEPKRMPEVTVGFCGTNGMPFLLQVMPARSSTCSASRPVSASGRRSTRRRWVSVPPETIASPASVSVAASVCALATTARA